MLLLTVALVVKMLLLDDRVLTTVHCKVLPTAVERILVRQRLLDSVRSERGVRLWLSISWVEVGERLFLADP